uniref:Uncharacterized protein n=1 Tax=Arundo donax TaxID=35708 RepID=A0A0A8Z314_ARUDO
MGRLTDMGTRECHSSPVCLVSGSKSESLLLSGSTFQCAVK